MLNLATCSSSEIQIHVIIQRYIFIAHIQQIEQ